LLSIAPLYSAFQTAIGANRARARFVSEHVRFAPGDKILDIGCGTGEILGFLGGQTYVGFDPDAGYIESAVARYGHLGQFSVGGVTDPPPLARDFDLAISIGVLHHLDDVLSRALVDLARAHLRPGGRLVTLDPVLVTGQHPVARGLAKRDRGSFVRSPDEYEAIVRGHFESVQITQHHDFLRVPYSHLAMECQ